MSPLILGAFPVNDPLTCPDTGNTVLISSSAEVTGLSQTVRAGIW